MTTRGLFYPLSENQPADFSDYGSDEQGANARRTGFDLCHKNGIKGEWQQCRGPGAEDDRQARRPAKKAVSRCA
jgi:hypothetical protein